MNCKYHNEKESTAKCKICGAPLCPECDEVQKKYFGCPNCAKKYLTQVFQNYTRGLVYNILSVICFVAFVVLYIVDLSLKNLNTLFIVLGAVIIAVLGSLSIFLFCYTLKKIKKIKSILLLTTEQERIDEKLENENKQNIENQETENDKNVEANSDGNLENNSLDSSKKIGEDNMAKDNTKNTSTFDKMEEKNINHSSEISKLKK